MKPEWGTKRACRKCATHFYDLNKTEFKCPKCEATYTSQDFVIKNTRATSELTSKKDALRKDPHIFENSMDDLDKVLDDDELETDLEEEDIIEDAADLEDDDFHEVMKHDSENE